MHPTGAVREGSMVPSAFRRGNLVRLWLGVVCLLGLPAATLAQNPASYNEIQKDAFMRRWLVLGEIPIAPDSVSKPDEESQKKAFSTDWLAPHGGEAGIVPSLSAELTIFGKAYRWQAVESRGDPVRLE